MPAPPRSLILPLFALVLIAIVLATAADGEPATAPTALSLKQAEEIALRNQPTLLQAHGLLEAAEGRVEEARSGYLPQVTVNGSYERTTSNFAPRPGVLPNSISTGGTSGSTLTATPTHVSWNPQYNYYLLGVTGSQLLYDFGLTSNKWRAAAASRDAAGQNTRTAELQTLLTVRRAYFLARAQRDLVAVADETVKNQEKHVEQTQAFVRTGIQPDINLATVLTALANARVQLVTARNNDALAQAQLAQAMGVTVGSLYALGDAELPAVAGEDGPTAALVDRAERARPELANLIDQKRAQELTVRSIKGAYGPALSAIANLSDNGT
ncbi:MAG TPA: TolC family protein, partial [Polyangia bacterium]|nr:TolC family protein [Polyangia bacterium]